jgi:hypothetical protein
VAADNPAFSSIGGVLFNSNQTVLVQYPPRNTATAYAIPGTVVAIGDNAFAQCRNLTRVLVPGSVNSIGAGAFSGCSSLVSMTILSGLTNLGASTFADSGLTSVSLPSSVTSIGEGAFSDCGSLTAITVDPANPAFSSTGGVLFDNSQATLIRYPSAAAGSSYTVPGSVVSIGDNAFNGAANLAEVMIPASVTNIGYAAFARGASLAAISVDANNPAYSSLGGVLFDKNQTTLIQYPPTASGTSYAIPASVTSIGDWAFSGCNLAQVTLPNGVTNLGNCAFCGSDLYSATIGNGVTTIGSNAFHYCAMLTNVTIGSSVTGIGDGAFSFSGLTHLTIPDSVTTIGVAAFLDCPTLVWPVTLGKGVAYLGGNAFGGTGSRFYFEGNAPAADPNAFAGDYAAICYLPGTTGWSDNFDGLPAIEILPYPTIMRGGSSIFGAKPEGFGLTIMWATNLPVVVEATTSLADPLWTPLTTNTTIFSQGTFNFLDTQSTNYPARFYRVTAQ